MRKRGNPSTVNKERFTMKKIKVGFLPLYIKLYDDANGVGYRAPMEK